MVKFAKKWNFIYAASYVTLNDLEHLTKNYLISLKSYAPGYKSGSNFLPPKYSVFTVQQWNE